MLRAGGERRRVSTSSGAADATGVPAVRPLVHAEAGHGAAVVLTGVAAQGGHALEAGERLRLVLRQSARATMRHKRGSGHAGWCNPLAARFAGRNSAPQRAAHERIASRAFRVAAVVATQMRRRKRRWACKRPLCARNSTAHAHQGLTCPHRRSACSPGLRTDQPRCGLRSCGRRSTAQARERRKRDARAH